MIWHVDGWSIYYLLTRWTIKDILHSLMIMFCINNEATKGLIWIYVYGPFMQIGHELHLEKVNRI